MVKRIILLSGPIASGKTTIAIKLAKQFNMTTIRTRKLLQRTLSQGSISDRYELQAEGERLDKITGGRWLHDELVYQLQCLPSDVCIVVDSVRTLNQINAIRETYGGVVYHIHLTASPDILKERYYERLDCTDESDKHIIYSEMSSNRTERLVECLQTWADIVIDNSGRSDRDVLSHVASTLNAIATLVTNFSLECYSLCDEFFHILYPNLIITADKIDEIRNDMIENTSAAIGQKLKSGPSGAVVGSMATTANAATIMPRTANIKPIAIRPN